MRTMENAGELSDLRPEVDTQYFQLKTDMDGFALALTGTICQVGVWKQILRSVTSMEGLVN